MDELEAKIRAILMKKPEEGQAPAETPCPRLPYRPRPRPAREMRQGPPLPLRRRAAPGKAEARGSASKKLDISAEDFE